MGVPLALAFAPANFDHVKVLLIALEIGGAKRSLRPFADVEQPPVMAVDVQMAVVPAGCRLAKRFLHVAIELITHERATRVVAQTP